MDRISTVILKCFFFERSIRNAQSVLITYRVCFCIAFDVKWSINKRIPREDCEGDTKLSHDLRIFSFEMGEKVRTNHREKEH